MRKFSNLFGKPKELFELEDSAKQFAKLRQGMRINHAFHRAKVLQKVALEQNPVAAQSEVIAQHENIVDIRGVHPEFDETQAEVTIDVPNTNMGRTAMRGFINQSFEQPSHVRVIQDEQRVLFDQQDVS